MENRPDPSIWPEYKAELRRGYFNADGALKSDFVQRYSEAVARSFLVGSRHITNTQLRNFYNHVRTASSVFALTDRGPMAETTLINKINKLDAIVSYNKGRDNINIPDEFVDFVRCNLEACRSAKDVISGFIPHFETVVGYFKYAEQTGRGRR